VPALQLPSGSIRLPDFLHKKRNKVATLIQFLNQKRVSRKARQVRKGKKIKSKNCQDWGLTSFVLSMVR